MRTDQIQNIINAIKEISTTRTDYHSDVKGLENVLNDISKSLKKFLRSQRNSVITITNTGYYEMLQKYYEAYSEYFRRNH